MPSTRAVLSVLLLACAGLLAHCQVEACGDSCTVPIILELSDAKTGAPIESVQVEAFHRSRPADSCQVVFDSRDKCYRIYGPGEGLYRIRATHPEYQDLALDSIKVEMDGEQANCRSYKTQTLRIEVSPRDDSTSLEGRPFQIKDSIAKPRC